MTSTTLPETTHPLQAIDQDRFTVACRQAAELMHKPEYNGRLDKAIDLVLSGAVTLHDDDTATVKSGRHTYQLEPDCTCQDSQNRTMYCKHYLAVRLLKRTYERLGEHAGGNGHEVHNTDPQPTVWECAQAPSSCTLKWSCNGIEMLLTLRDATDDALFSRIKRVLPKIEKKLDAQHQMQNGGDNGQHDASYCTIHQVTMTHSKDGKGCYHKAGEKPGGKAIWCRGK